MSVYQYIWSQGMHVHIPFCGSEISLVKTIEKNECICPAKLHWWALAINGFSVESSVLKQKLSSKELYTAENLG